MKTGKSFTWRLATGIIIPGVLLFLLAFGLVAITSRRIISREARKSASLTTQAAILEIEKTLSRVETSLANIDLMMDDEDMTEEDCYNITRHLVECNPEVVGSAIAFPPTSSKGAEWKAPYSYVDTLTGEIRSKQLASYEYDYCLMDWYQIPVLLGRPCWSEPYFDKGGGDRVMSTYSVPVFSEDGKLLYVQTADISLDWLREKLDELKPYPHSYSVMLGRSARIITNTRYPKDIMVSTVFVDATWMHSEDAFNLGLRMVAGETGVEKVKFRKHYYYAAYGPLSNGWSFTTICPHKDIFFPLLWMNLVLIFCGLMTLLLLSVLTVTGLRRLAKPIREFADAARTVAGGDFEAALPVIDTDDEFGQLRDNFAFMQTSLRNYIEELKVTTAAKERYEGELEVGRKIQLDMVPKVQTDDPNVDIGAFLQPAREVGGDLYDFFENDGKFYFAIGDVSGKGVPAALCMATTLTAFRFAASSGIPIEEVAKRVNNLASDRNEELMFVTMFMAVLDVKTGKLQYCNAGHNPVVFVSSDGKASFLPVKANLVMGLFPDIKYEAQEMVLEPGARLVLYTDGVTEAMTEDGSFYGDDRLLAWAGKVNPSASSRDAVDSLYNDVVEFVAGAEQSDDITILALRLK